MRPLFVLGICAFAAGFLSLLNLPTTAGFIAIVLLPLSVILMVIGLAFLAMMAFN